MTRYIDADKIEYEPLPKCDRNYRTFNLDDAYEDGYSDAMVDVRNAPTEDVISIDWLIQFRNNLDTLSEGKLMDAIDTIIDAWACERKEE